MMYAMASSFPGFACRSLALLFQIRPICHTFSTVVEPSCLSKFPNLPTFTCRVVDVYIRGCVYVFSHLLLVLCASVPLFLRASIFHLPSSVHCLRSSEFCYLYIIPENRLAVKEKVGLVFAKPFAVARSQTGINTGERGFLARIAYCVVRIAQRKGA
jgi:hypothetical protein